MIVHPAAAFFVCDNTQEFFIDKVLKKGESNIIKLATVLSASKSFEAGKRVRKRDLE